MPRNLIRSTLPVQTRAFGSEIIGMSLPHTPSPLRTHTHTHTPTLTGGNSTGVTGSVLAAEAAADLVQVLTSCTTLSCAVQTMLPYVKPLEA